MFVRAVAAFEHRSASVLSHLQESFRGVIEKRRINVGHPASDFLQLGNTTRGGFAVLLCEARRLVVVLVAVKIK